MNSELSFVDWFLTGMLIYGPPALGLALLLGALGVPMPASTLLLVAGTLIQQDVFDGPLTAGLALTSVVLGDSGSYWLGRTAGARLLRRVAQTAIGRRAQALFERWGGLAIFITRFLFTPLWVPVSLLAGSNHYPYWRFVVFDVAGEVIWVALYIGLGYYFAGSWEAIGDLANDLSGVLLGLATLGGGGYLAYRIWWRRTAEDTN
jgi:membrane-associated protein